MAAPTPRAAPTPTPRALSMRRALADEPASDPSLLARVRQAALRGTQKLGQYASVASFGGTLLSGIVPAAAAFSMTLPVSLGVGVAAGLIGAAASYYDTKSADEKKRITDAMRAALAAYVVEFHPDLSEQALTEWVDNNVAVCKAIARGKRTLPDLTLELATAANLATADLEEMVGYCEGRKPTAAKKEPTIELKAKTPKAESKAKTPKAEPKARTLKPKPTIEIKPKAKTPKAEFKLFEPKATQAKLKRSKAKLNKPKAKHTTRKTRSKAL